MVGIYKRACGLKFTGIIAENEEKAWEYLDKKLNEDFPKYAEVYGLELTANRDCYEIRKVILIQKGNKNDYISESMERIKLSRPHLSYRCTVRSKGRFSHRSICLSVFEHSFVLSLFRASASTRRQSQRWLHVGYYFGTYRNGSIRRIGYTHYIRGLTPLFL